MSNYISINACISAIENIENELGIKPSGAYPTVRVRLDVLESRINAGSGGGGGGGSFTAGGDLAGTSTSQTVIAIHGNPVSLIAPTVGQFLIEGSGESIWTSLSGDVSASTSTIGKLTVTGLEGSVLPSLAIGNLNWTGSAWAFTPSPTSLPPNGVAGGDLTGSYPNPTLITTPVTPGPYGNTSHFTNFTVDAKGRITSASQVALPVIPTSLPPNGAAGGMLSGSYPNPSLITSGVIAGTYGDTSYYPKITVDGYGRITSASQAALPIPSGFTAGGDLSGSNTSQKVIGIDGYAVPTPSANNTVLTYNSGALSWSAASSGFTAGGDLTGSSTSQQVAQISGATGNWQWLASVHNPSITHLPETTDTGATNLTINAQSAWTGSVTNVYGGSLYLQAGAASDTAPGASISLSGASPRSVANASDIQFSADQYQFSAATTATGNTFILDPINADFYANSASPAPSLGSSAKYWNTTYTNNLYVNQITNPIAPTAGQFLMQNSSANGIVWTTIFGDVIAGTTNNTVGKITVTGLDGYVLPPLTAGYLNYTGSAWELTVLPSSLPPSGTAGGDLTGTYPNPTLIAMGSTGTYGDGYHYPVITTDGKGRVTSVSSQAVSGAPGDFYVSGNLSVAGTETITGQSTFESNATITGTLTVTDGYNPALLTVADGYVEVASLRDNALVAGVVISDASGNLASSIPDGTNTSLIWTGSALEWVSQGGSPLGPNNSWAVPQWYIDPVNGNDGYTGTSSTINALTMSGPLQTFQGLVSIWGTLSPVLTGPVVVSYMNSVNGSDIITLSPVIQTGASILFDGYNTTGPNIDPSYPNISGFIDPAVQTVVHVVSATSKSRTVDGYQWRIVADTDLTVLLSIYSGGSNINYPPGSMIHDITNNSWFWLDSVVSGTGVSAVLQLSQPMAKASAAAIFANTNAAYPNETDTIAPGDSLVVYTWPYVGISTFSDANDVNINEAVAFQNLTLHTNDGLTSAGGTLNFVECNLNETFMYIPQSTVQLVNCTCSYGVQCFYAQINGGVFGSFIDSGTAGSEIAGDTLASKYPFYLDGYTGNVTAENISAIIADGYAVYNSLTVNGNGLYITSLCAMSNLSLGSQNIAPEATVGATLNNSIYNSANYDGYGIIYGAGNFGIYNGAQLGVHAGTGPITATNNIRLPNIYVDDYGLAFDKSVTPAQWYPQRPITRANIDASISSGGYGGFVYGNYGSVLALFEVGTEPHPTPTPYLGTAGLNGYTLPAPSGSEVVLTFNSGSLSWGTLPFGAQGTIATVAVG